MPRKNSVVHVCSFTSLDLKRKDHRDLAAVLAAVKAAGGRFSVFDATQTPEMARTMTRIERDGYTRRAPEDEKLGYPWIQVEITEKGEKLLKENDA